MTGHHLPPCLLAMPRRDKHSVWQHEVCHLHVHLLASGMLLLYRDLREGRCRLGTHWSPQLFPTALPSEILFFTIDGIIFSSFHSTQLVGLGLDSVFASVSALLLSLNLPSSSCPHVLLTSRNVSNHLAALSLVLVLSACKREFTTPPPHSSTSPKRRALGNR